MKHTILFLIVFLLFIIQGTVMQVFTPDWFGYSFPAVPHFVLIAVLLIGFFFNRTTALTYALIFGFLTDLIFTNIIGVYAFTITFTVYLITSLTKIFHMNLIVVFFVCLLGVALLEFQVYGIYSLIGKIDQPFIPFLKVRLTTAFILNGVFTIILFYPLRNYLLGMNSEKAEE